MYTVIMSKTSFSVLSGQERLVTQYTQQSSYGPPLAYTASYLAQHSFLFGPVGAVNIHVLILTNSINSLLFGSKYIPNGAHTNHC